MPITELSGPFRLMADEVNRVLKHVSPGAYALGKCADGKNLNVEYVGRSDTDLKARLLTHAAEAEHAYFKCDYFSSAELAFAKECRLYHDFPNPKNKVHPGRPASTKWSCPMCKIFD